MGRCARMVQTELHPDHGHTDLDSAGRFITVVGSRRGQVRVKQHEFRLRLELYERMQLIAGRKSTDRYEL